MSLKAQKWQNLVELCTNTNCPPNPQKLLHQHKLLLMRTLIFLNSMSSRFTYIFDRVYYLFHAWRKTQNLNSIYSIGALCQLTWQQLTYFLKFVIMYRFYRWYISKSTLHNGVWPCEWPNLNYEFIYITYIFR